MSDGVGGKLGCHEDDLVSNGASIEDGPQVGPYTLDLFRPARVGLHVEIVIARRLHTVSVAGAGSRSRPPSAQCDWPVVAWPAGLVGAASKKQEI